jgi:tetratricopeptide (TPR) repeat protein
MTSAQNLLQPLNGNNKKMMKMFFRTFLTVTLSLSFAVASAQNESSYKSNFDNGKELLKLGRYGLAMQAFKPLTSSIEGNPYNRIAAFYYAVAAFNDEQSQVAKDMFLQITSKYPDWEKIDEVNFWLTNIYLKEGDYQKGLTFASKIKNAELLQSATLLKESYLTDMTYPELDSLLGIYPSDKVIAGKLADKIIEQSIHEQDREYLENIVSVFELDKAKYRIEESIKSVKKDRYQVALLLPFMGEEIKTNSKHLSNEFVIELYEGILMGVNDLRSKGINMSLHLYDTKKDGRTTARLLELEEMQHMDLIIGPLYPEPVKIVSEFVYNHQINMINPLSTNSEIVGNNPYAFLYMPSNEIQASRAADYISGKTANKNAVIFHGMNKSDSVLAYSYKQEIEQKGFTVCKIEKVPTEEGKRILDILTNSITVEFDASEFDSLVMDENIRGNLKITEKDYLVIQPDSIGHIFVASDEPALVANAITGLETRRDTIILVGLEKWLDNRTISLGGLNRLNAHLIAPTFVDKSKPKYESLNALYMETFNAFPTKNFYTGYEVIMTAGKLMKASGNLFQFEPGVNNFIAGEIYQGLKYGDANCNQVVPIIKFENKEIVLANPR